MNYAEFHCHLSQRVEYVCRDNFTPSHSLMTHDASLTRLVRTPAPNSRVSPRRIPEPPSIRPTSEKKDSL